MYEFDNIELLFQSTDLIGYKWMYEFDDIGLHFQSTDIVGCK